MKDLSCSSTNVARVIALLALAACLHGEEKGSMIMESIAEASWHFGGELGKRIDANVSNWLLRAPGANPGMLELFRRRDRHLPYQTPVPWAGEFAGKYLISAVQACRISTDPELPRQTQAFVDELVSCQAENGYLGQWPKDEQLLGHWDLWGHYHCMLGLLMWYDQSGDQRVYDCVLRAAECICRVYVDGARRPIEAGSPSMNLAVLHIIAELYRRTDNPRYMALIRRLEEDLRVDGDWLRQGSAGVPYFKLPGSGPRWESLHIVQAFATLYQATGEKPYRDAVLSLWRSVRDFDRHPSGAFSSNEGATGTIYSKGAIETCCSVAWMALSIDALRLSGDATIADELELTLWNQALAQQHPSGNWCTYDTPINGIRAPSYHQINFQYRPGAPELNCCSVNGPRTLGMCSEWAVMSHAQGLAINFYGPSQFDITRGNGQHLRLVQETRYPVGGRIQLTLYPENPVSFVLQLRIPAWSRRTTVNLNGSDIAETPQPGTYLSIERVWKPGDTLHLGMDMTARVQAGHGPDRGGRGAIHTGPLLLAFDAQYNETEVSALTSLNAADLELAAEPLPREQGMGHFPPMGLRKARTDAGASITLCDFASAGARGTEYAAWLPVSHLSPSPPMLVTPGANATGRPGPITFCWTPAAGPDETYQVLVARDAACRDIVLHLQGLDVPYATVREELASAGHYYWRVVAINPFGQTINDGGSRAFIVDPKAPSSFFAKRQDGLLLAVPLAGNGKPRFGRLNMAEAISAAPDHHDRRNAAVRFDGKASRLRYDMPLFPETDYSFSAWICPEGLPADAGIQQVFSAWCQGMDDPLRVTLDQHTISARIEAGRAWRTPGVTLENSVWIHVAAVKQGNVLTLYINGKAVQSTAVPERIRSRSTQVGIGFNPLYGGGEYFSGRISRASFHARAFTAAEVARIAETAPVNRD